MEISSVLAAAQAYVTRQYESHPDPVLVYHNLVHTSQVVQAADQISAYYRLSEADHLIVMLAAWFHDMGYLEGERTSHESAGADAVLAFAKAQGLPEATGRAAADCILATKMPQQPNNLLEQIVCRLRQVHDGQESGIYGVAFMRCRARISIVRSLSLYAL